MPEQEPGLDRLPRFLESIRAEQFDLAIQMHGSGLFSNEVIAGFGARNCAGFHVQHCPCPDPRTFLPYPDQGLELRRLLRLVEHLGIPPCGEELEFPVWDGDRDTRSVGLFEEERFGSREYVCIHGGASVPERRWPVERFAAVADFLASRGYGSS